MTTPGDVLRLATAELGYSESPAGSNRTKFGQWYGMDGNPWCAMFVSYCFYTAGVPLPATTPKGFSYCESGLDWFKNNNGITDAPQPGDVVFYQFDKDAQADHVGIVESVNADGSLVAIEGNTSLGNQSNGGQVMRRTRARRLVKGIGRPAWPAAPAPQQPAPAPEQPPPPPPPAHPPWPGRNLALTSPYTRGTDVTTWQRQMAARGWRIDVDGIFGPGSQKVCISFQKEKGLQADGVVGPVTWDAAWTAPQT